MKTDYKIGDTVTISRPSQSFDGLIGEVMGNNPDATRPLKIKLGDFGTWQFFYGEILRIGVQNKPTETIKTETPTVVSSKEKEGVTMANLVENIKQAFPKEKLAYSKRVSKPKDDKPKRKYNRKKVD